MLSFVLQVLFVYLIFKGGAISGILKAIIWFIMLIPLLMYGLVWITTKLMVPGKCPNCGLRFQAARGKVNFKCPSCQTSSEFDKATKQFVRAAPSWEQGSADASGGGEKSKANNGSGDPKADGDKAIDIIDVEFHEVTDVNESN